MASPSSAQDIQDVAQATAAPPHLAFVDGSATLEREGQAETAVSGMPFVPGDRLQTTRGRIEILFADGSTLAVDEFTAIELQDLTMLRLTAGRLLLTVAGVNDPAAAQRYQVDTPAASASTDGPGEYRIALMNGRGAVETELAVFRGYATLATDIGSTAVRAGERTLARDSYAPSHPLPFNSARFDAFELWAAARRDARTGTASARYLPRDLYGYSNTFDRYGSWTYEGSYGYVWYPTVAPGWRPYHHGYWSPLARYGWTWIGYDSWGWPTHHYGRWGYAGSRWFWIPGRTWGPAWVSWASAPGYVGWCPLGFDGRPVFGLSVTVGNPWHGWVVVSRPHFGHRYAVHRYALPPASIPARTSFVAAAKAPLALPPSAAPRAIPRPPATAPVQRAGARAVPRGGSAVASTPGSVPSNPQGSVPANAVAPAGARARQALSRGTDEVQANVNRYVPDTTALGGRRASAAREANAPPPATRESGQRTATPRWYPPVTMTPRKDAGSTPAGQPSTPAAPPRWETNPGSRRSAPPATITPNQPELSGPGRVPGASPWSAQPRRPVEAPASPPAAPQMTPRSAPPQSARPADAGPSRAPVAVPRAAPPPQGAQGAQPRAAAPPRGDAQRAAPAQPSGERQAPAGARPRSR